MLQDTGIGTNIPKGTPGGQGMRARLPVRLHQIKQLLCNEQNKESLVKGEVVGSTELKS